MANCFGSAISYSLDKLGCSHLTLKDEQRLAMKAVYDGSNVFLCLATGKTTLAPVHHTVSLRSCIILLVDTTALHILHAPVAPIVLV